MNHSSIRAYLTRRLGIMLPLGFASGLPLALTGGTLQAWLTEAGLDLTTIGLFAYVGLPYTMKFLWAPVMDRIVPPWLGRRRGWMIVTQGGLALALRRDPATHKRLMIIATMMVSRTTLRRQGGSALVWRRGCR